MASPVEPYEIDPGRSIVWTSNLHEALQQVEEDIAEGKRFPLEARIGKCPHWSQSPVEENPTTDRETIFDIEIDSQETPHQNTPRPVSSCHSTTSSTVTRVARSPEPPVMAAPIAASHDKSGVSPSSSPRLPSPPPFTEVQFGPKSPSVSGAVSEFSLDNKVDDGASRRIRPGTKAADMARGPPFVPLHQLDSAFQLQEYLNAFYCKLTNDDVNKTTKPVDKEMALQLATPPTSQDTGETVDRNLWLYELCRLLCNLTSRIICGFFTDNPPCSAATCPEMRASEWQYLCAVHEPPKSCSAIDYCNHTLDWASNILSSSKHFPSRISLGAEGGNPYQSMRQLTNIFRRVYRIYAHGWFQHREIFWATEARFGLYVFFKTVCDQYQLIPEDNYTIPPEAEGQPQEQNARSANQPSPEKPGNISILRKGDEGTQQTGEDQSTNILSTGATTRRHKHTPSTGAPVSMIAEGQEEEEEETTILDMGGPGPAQETSSSLSPAKPLMERAKSPGLISIPVNTDPERVPEDPTPVAQYDVNPFGSPGPTEVTGSSSPEYEDPMLATNPKTEETATATGKDEGTTQPASSITDNPEAMSAVLGHMDKLDNPKALDSDTETQIAIEDTKDDVGQDELNESMDKIDLSDIEKKPEVTANGSDEKSSEAKTDDSKESKEESA